MSLPTRVSSSFSLMKPASPIWIASHRDSRGTKCDLPARHGRVKCMFAAFVPIFSFLFRVLIILESHSLIVVLGKSAMRKWKFARPPAKRFAATTLCE